MRWPPGISTERQTWSSWRTPGDAQEQEGGRRARGAELLPDEVVASGPVLSVHFRRELLARGQLEGWRPGRGDAERWLDTTAGICQGPQAAAEMVVVDDDDFRRLPAGIRRYWVPPWPWPSYAPGTVRHARRTLELPPR